jgi:BRCT domain type II-containing protein
LFIIKALTWQYSTKKQMMGIQQRFPMQEIAQLQQNTAKGDLTFPIGHYPQDSPHQQSSGSLEPPDLSRLEDSSDVSEDDSTCSYSSEIPSPREISICLRPCTTAIPLDPSTQKTPSEWAYYLEAQFGTDAGYIQHRSIPFTYSAADDIPMTYEQFGDIMLYPPQPAIRSPLQKSTSSQEDDSSSTIADFALEAQHAAEIDAENNINSSRPVAEEAKPYFGKFGLDDSRLAAPTTKAAFIQESAQIKAALDESSMTQVLETPSGNEDDKQKWSSRLKNDDSILEGDRLDIFEGTDNCLAGLTFVFTGQFTYIPREKAQDLVKRFGGKCVSAPSKKTSFIVVGAEADLKKLAIIKQHNLRVIDEKGLVALISRLPARDCRVPKQKKGVKRSKNATEDVLTTTFIPYQEDDRVSTATPGYQSPQQTL